MCLIYSLFFNDTATTEIYTLSLHDALPISQGDAVFAHQADLVLAARAADFFDQSCEMFAAAIGPIRSEEHTSELQSRRDLVCRLLLEKKKKKKKIHHTQK